MLTKFMDKHLLKDSLEDSWLKYEEFEDFLRSDSQTIDAYIHEFEHKYERVKLKGISLPSKLLAFKLLKCALLSRDERLLIMTGIDTSNEASMYEDAKRSLKKFKGGSVGILGNSSENESIRVIKQEVLFAQRDQGSR